jgi:hypothetical protein
LPNARAHRARSTPVSRSQDRYDGIDDLLPGVDLQDRNLGSHEIATGREELARPSVALSA